MDVASLPPTDVIVFRGVELPREAIERLCAELEAKGWSKPIIIQLPEGATMDFLDEERMLELGWVKVKKDE